MPDKLKSPPLTAETAGHIKWLWQHTSLNQAQISAHLGAINQGRVSEVVTGYRYGDVEPLEVPGWNADD